MSYLFSFSSTKTCIFCSKKSVVKNVREIHFTDQEIRLPFHTPIKIGWSHQYSIWKLSVGYVTAKGSTTMTVKQTRYCLPPQPTDSATFVQYSHRLFQFNSKSIKYGNISFLTTLVTLTLGWRHNLNTARDILEVNLDLALEKTSVVWLCTRPCLSNNSVQNRNTQREISSLEMGQISILW
jgi:hypothetical protein